MLVSSFETTFDPARFGAATAGGKREEKNRRSGNCGKGRARRSISFERGAFLQCGLITNASSRREKETYHMLDFSCRISNRERYISLFPRECDEIFKYRYSNQFSLGSINLIVSSFDGFATRSARLLPYRKKFDKVVVESRRSRKAFPLSLRGSLASLSSP